MATKKPTGPTVTKKAPPKRRASNRKLTTPSGMSIMDIAMALKQKDPTVSFDEHMTRAQDVVEAEQTLERGGASKFTHGLLTGVLGKHLGSAVASSISGKERLEQAATLVAQHRNQMAEPVQPKQLDMIMKKLDAIGSEVQALKAVRMGANGGQPTPHRETIASKTMAQQVNNNLKDAREALKGLGLQKAEIDALLARADPNADTSEIIRSALRDHDKVKNPKAQKLNRAEIKPTIEAVRDGLKTEVHPTPGLSPMEEPKKAEPVAPPPQSRPIQANDATHDESQQEAMSIAKAMAEQKKEEARQKRMEMIEKTLKDIEEKIGNTGLIGLISGALMWLGKHLLGLAGKGLWKLVKEAVKITGKAIWAALKLAWKGAKALFSSIKNLFKHGAEAGEKMAEKATEKAAEKGGEKILEKEGAKLGAEEAAKIGAKGLGKSLLKKIPVIGALAGAAFAVGDLMEGDTVGAGMDLSSGLVSIVPGVGTAASVAIDAAKAARDFGVIGDKAGTMAANGTKVPGSMMASDTAADALADNDSDDEPPLEWDDSDEKAPATPVVVQDNRKTVIQQPAATPIIKVRNDEPSASGLVASLFDHPLAYGSVYRM